MKELLFEIANWLGYLERPVVLAQLLITVAAVACYRFAARWRHSSLGLRFWHQLALLIALALATASLAILGSPYRLLWTLLLLIAGWFALEKLRLRLKGVMPSELLRDLDSGLFRPIYLVIAALTLLREIDAPRNLALIPLGQIFGTELTLGQVVLSMVVIYVLVVGAAPPSTALAWMLQRLVGLSDSGRRAVALVIQYLLVGVGVLWIFDQIGLNRTAILAVAGGLSVGLGFGVKEVFSNFISGLWLLFEGSVRPGDVLFIDGDPCEVRSLGLRAAVLWRDRDNAELVIPNQTFFTTTTITYTGTDRLRRSQVLVGAAYRHPPKEVMRVMEAAAAAVAGVLAQPPPKALLLSYGDSSINYALRFWIADPLRNVTTTSAVSSAIWQAFQDDGIEIPFPQRVLHEGRLPAS